MQKVTHKKTIKQIVPNTKGLTKKQELFCQIYCTHDHLTQTECAIKAGYSPLSAGVSASELLNGRDYPHVVARIEELKAELAEKYEITFDNHVRMMAQIRDKALEAGNFTAAVTAEKSRGQVAGLYVDRKEILMGRIDQMSREEVMNEIRKLQAEYPQLAGPSPLLELKATDITNEQKAGTKTVGSTEPSNKTSSGVGQD